MTTQAVGTVPVSSLSVRERLVDALKLDLVGPWPRHALANERLPGWVRPSNWYLTGFLIPSGTPPDRSADADEDDDLDEIPESSGLAQESTEERKAAKKGFFPSSIGLSFLVPAALVELGVTVTWGDYVRQEMSGADGNPLLVWQRMPREERVSVLITGATDRPYPVPDSRDLELHVVARQISAKDLAAQIPDGTRSVSIFLVNRRAPVAKANGQPDVAYAFQPEISVHGERPFMPRPDLRSARAVQWDEQVADLHYADTPEYATGHGVSADWEVVNGECHRVWTAWIPSAEVEKTDTVPIPGLELSMEALGAVIDGSAAGTLLRPVIVQYRAWIEKQHAGLDKHPGTRRETAEELLRLAGIAADRIEHGIAVLTKDADALDAFRVANRAVARALRKRLRIAEPQWRAFQLAFLLLNLPGMADSRNPDRETVDLLFFPTGGGKTEAYLGLAAFAMVLRRLRNPGQKGLAAAGVSVIMRYTLRLLTLDQLSRAAGLVCALELERECDRARYGEWPFEVGLWVGKAATPNVLGRKGDGRSDTARSKVSQFKNDPQHKPSPIPLKNCPWCGARFRPESFSLEPDSDHPHNLRIVCVNPDCDFTRDRGLPIVSVDEPIYHRLPAFVIATVDKFASLPWVGQAGVLLGGADRYDATGFYGPAEPAKGARLAAPLGPPDLVIQDELHLISGPLGTMAGLYEASIEALCMREVAGLGAKPKIVASTATVRRAQDQIQALFARPLTQVFPPPGPDRRDSFFARTKPASEIPARQYLGIASQGRNPKVLMRRAWLALMGAAERAFRDAGGHLNTNNPADPYMTVLGYFNSLRELGGARRILEEEVQNTIKAYGARKRIGEDRGLFQDRKNFSEVVELTSRVSTDKVAQARRRLETPFDNIKQRVDCAIATNMISVGLDIPRLGLMVVLGQPKTHAEYIQATSRVGRETTKPGLVVTLLNIHKPRDRSHYERFRHYHETFYGSVEVASVTPFSARALDRGFAGAFVGLARHIEPELSPPRGAERIAHVRATLERTLLEAFLGRVRQQPFADEAEREERLRSVQNRIVDLLDSWRAIYEDYQAAGVEMQYQRYELKQPRPLLHDILETNFESADQRKFRANRSLRDVEPDVNLFLRDLGGAIIEENGMNRRAHGQIRQGQVITTYGPGALIDLPRHSAIVGGLDTWPKIADLEEVLEPRLTRKLQIMTGVPDPRLFAPPPDSNDPSKFSGGIGAWRFPEWFVVQESGGDDQRERSRRLVHRKQLDDRRRFDGQQVVATRFVRACPRGHVDDLDWRSFVHGVEDKCTRQLWLDELGTSGDLAELVVRCECKKSKSLYEATQVELNPLRTCRGARPWLGKNANEDCKQHSRLLIRTASNAYFPQVMSVLSLPDRGSAINTVIQELWDDLQIVDAAGDLALLKKKPKIAERLSQFGNEEVLEAIHELKTGKVEDEPVKRVELEALLTSPEGFGEDVPVDPNFHARRLPGHAWRRSDHSTGIESVVQLHRLREVLALVGFTRFEAVTPDINGEYESDVERAQIALEPTWFPAVENRGEGVFVQLRAEAVESWLARPAVRERLDALAKGHQRWMADRKTQRPFPGGPYVMLHTLSHLLIQSLAMRCGYPASSIHERVYADTEMHRFGVLLYTGSPNAEGTLGGLVQQARHIEEHLEEALRVGALCSNDPICAQHAPGESMEGRWLHGAACHGCALVAETSCEMRNDYLDRALVMPVLGLSDAAFFPALS